MENEKGDEKGLASRVEELHAVIKQLRFDAETIKRWIKQKQFDPQAAHILLCNMTELAGAHAEEKPNV